MRTSRLEAFSDGVLAIIITIMVLELHPPSEPTWASLADLKVEFLSYALSFVYIGIYWNNHHHLFQITRKVSGAILWCNLILLFWLSIMPFATAWLDESSLGERVPVIAYGIVLLCAAVSFYVLQQVITRSEGPDGLLAEAFGADHKGQLSLVLYVLGIASSYVAPLIGVLFYVAVAAIWVVPDRRVERFVATHAVD